jgi:hypothetical protein
MKEDRALKHCVGLITAAVLFSGLSLAHANPMTFIPANNPCIHYSGRWDMTDALHPKHSWPGVYVTTTFTGTRIGILMNDNTNYYNVYVDGKLHRIFHGTMPGIAEYILADTLGPSTHTFRFSKRNIAFDEIFSIDGFLLNDGDSLLPAPSEPNRKIEFIGDSFTAAESNEATAPSLPWVERFPVTNIDKGFAVLMARHFNAQYHTTCRSGSGMVCDWQGKTNVSIPALFDRTLMERKEPKWDFKQWVPDVVVIILGLNDQTGLKGPDGRVSEANSIRFKQTYLSFLKTIRSEYPGLTIIAVAAPPPWIRTNVREVVDEERRRGNTDIHYAHFDEFPGGYVANNHPTVETHEKIAAQIIQEMESLKVFGGKTRSAN